MMKVDECYRPIGLLPIQDKLPFLSNDLGPASVAATAAARVRPGGCSRTDGDPLQPVVNDIVNKVSHH